MRIVPVFGSRIAVPPFSGRKWPFTTLPPGNEIWLMVLASASRSIIVVTPVRLVGNRRSGRYRPPGGVASRVLSRPVRVSVGGMADGRHQPTPTHEGLRWL